MTINVYKYLRERKETGPGTVVRSGRTWSKKYMSEHRDLFKQKKTGLFLLLEQSNTGTGTPERLWTLHHFRYSNITGHCLDQPALAAPALEEVLNYVISQGALQPQWFCDSLIINAKDFLNVYVADSQLHCRSAFPILSCVYLFHNSL